MTSSADDSDTVRNYNNMVTQLYTFNSWTRQKSVSNGYSSHVLPYVGFPGLTLTPIPENPLLDSMQQDDLDSCEREKWLSKDVKEEAWNPGSMTKGSLPNHWVRNGSDVALIMSEEDSEAGKHSKTSTKTSKTCSSGKQLVKAASFLPKDEPLTPEQKRAHLCKLLVFALFGFVIVAGIVLWIFSPAFT